MDAVYSFCMPNRTCIEGKVDIFRPDFLPTVCELGERVLPAVTVKPANLSERENPAADLIGASTGQLNQQQFSDQHVSISLDDSTLLSSRLAAPLIQITSEAAPTVLAPRPQLRDVPSDGTELEWHYKLISVESNPLGCRLDNGGPVTALNVCGNNLPRLSLPTARTFAPRTSWNGSRTALISMQRKPSRNEGVPAYLARKYHMATLGERLRDQVHDYRLRHLSYLTHPIVSFQSGNIIPSLRPTSSLEALSRHRISEATSQWPPRSHSSVITSKWGNRYVDDRLFEMSFLWSVLILLSSFSSLLSTIFFLYSLSFFLHSFVSLLVCSSNITFTYVEFSSPYLTAISITTAITTTTPSMNTIWHNWTLSFTDSDHK